MCQTKGATKEHWQVKAILQLKLSLVGYDVLMLVYDYIVRELHRRKVTGF